MQFSCYHVASCCDPCQFRGPRNWFALWTHAALTRMGGCADCMFNSLQGRDSNAAVSAYASSGFFQSCVFRDLMEAGRGVEIDPKRWELLTGTFDIREANSTLALSNCTLAELYGTAAIVVQRDAQVYSDDASHEVSLHRTLSAPALLAFSVSQSRSQVPKVCIV